MPGGLHRHTEAGPGPAGSVMLVGFGLNGQKFSALNGGPGFTFSETGSIVVPYADQAEVDCYWDDLLSGADRAMPTPDGAYHFVTQIAEP
jgi:predicted 3-demethylubiquinone-9 3-methyltransferase (glyoxalase superfamily)